MPGTPTPSPQTQTPANTQEILRRMRRQYGPTLAAVFIPIIVAAGTYPLEWAKTQVTNDTKLSAGDVLRKARAAYRISFLQGVKTTNAGFSAAMLRLGIREGCRGPIMVWSQKEFGSGTDWQTAAKKAAAMTLADIAAHPADTARTLKSVNPDATNIQLFKTLVRHPGKAFSGLTPATLRAGAQWSAMYSLERPANAFIRTQYAVPAGRKLPVMQEFQAAVLVGAGATVVTLPFDTVKTAMQLMQKSMETHAKPPTFSEKCRYVREIATSPRTILALLSYRGSYTMLALVLRALISSGLAKANAEKDGASSIKK